MGKKKQEFKIVRVNTNKKNKTELTKKGKNIKTNRKGEHEMNCSNEWTQNRNLG